MKRITLIFLMILIAAVLFGVVVMRRTAVPSTEVSSQRVADVLLTLTDPATNGAAPLNFEVVNKTGSTLVCPDSWYLEFADGTRTMLSLPQTGNIRVEAGQKENISIAKPVQTNSWRLGAGYYLENLVFDVKVRLEQSSLKNHLPPEATSIQGKNVVSDWVR